MMNISDQLTQKKLLEILMAAYKKGEEKENIRLVDLLEELKQNVILAIGEKD
ncbi:hypothetical protein [Neobacillus sp. PS3-40]|uniref:hypothetical protein n=1 Tax=Neobacillus sp. PS3-40 TaxID=3070679 RepID=UPI0027E09761|nr:hypothetical protein [Neobacillus sp. PS3-40]WML45821.1 hypothetical protein RCG20_08045 [Neobacillus sp. PS3-40]